MVYQVCAVDSNHLDGEHRSGPVESADIKKCFGRSAEEVGDLVYIMPSRDNGHKLLNKWDPEMPIKEGLQYMNNFTFKKHLQDLFDVIIALNCNDTLDLIRFDLFIYHRAYQRLGKRVLELSTHWGDLPFDILSTHLDTELKLKTFQSQYHDREFHSLIQSYVSPEPALSSASGTLSGTMYSVNTGNALQWLRTLKDLWIQLQSYLLVETSEGKITRKDSPNTLTVNNIVAMMFFFEGLMPVLRHLLSTQGAAQALANAEIHHKKSVDNRGRKQPKEFTEDDSELVLANDHSLPHHSAQRLLRAMETVLTWHISCRHIFKKARCFRLQSFQWRLSQFRYHGLTLPTTLFDVGTVSSLLQVWQGLSDNPCGVVEAERLIRQTCDANVHAEAALMHWIATVKDTNSSQDWPIGVNRKCCQLCWLLHIAYNNQRSSKFLLPRTHGIFVPWLPPPGLPDSILIVLRKVLLRACKRGVLAHHELNSASSVHPALDVPSLQRLKHMFM